MAYHRAQATFERSKWKLILLLPSWLLQLSITMTVIGLFIYRLVKCLEDREDGAFRHGPSSLEVAWESTNISLSVAATGCTIFDIARYMAEALTPRTVLLTQLVKLVCSIVMLVLDVLVYTHGMGELYAMLGLSLDVAFVVTTMTLAIYAILAFRRLRIYNEYLPTANAKPFGFNDNDSQDREMLYSRRRGAPMSAEKRLSSASSLGSFASRPSSSMESPKPQPSPRYNHERDTKFDAYRANRDSLESSEQLFSSMSEHGLYISSNSSTSNKPGSPDYELHGAKPRCVKIGSGGLRSAPRTPSWSADMVLVAVPEEDEAGSKGQKDLEALLGEALLKYSGVGRDGEGVGERESDGLVEVDLGETGLRVVR